MWKRTATISCWHTFGSATTATTTSSIRCVPCRSSVSLDRCDYPPDHFVYWLTGFVPVPHQHNVVRGVDPDDISAIADGGEAGCRPARPLLLLRVQPPQIAV